MHLRAILPAALVLIGAAAPLVAQRTAAASAPTSTAWPERAVRRDVPLGPMIRRAYTAGTRDSSGAPGKRYWQQRVDYVIDANLEVETATLRGSETITLHNTSPDTLSAIVLRLYQNYFTATVERNDYVTDITDGMRVERLTVNGAPIALDNPRSYSVNGTIATVRPSAPVLPGATATLTVNWSFKVPNVLKGQRGERMGRWGTELYQLAQWYPQVAMYDDLRGWDRSQYLGKGEFYNQFGSFDVKITVPSGWLVGATGTLTNAAEVLSPTARERLALAARSDTTVHVVTADERGPGKATATGQLLTWRFTAPMVNDFAFVASSGFVWDAARAMAPEPTLVQALYLPEHTEHQNSVQRSRFALEHHARFVMPYDFPQATVADGPEDGMEYPMIIFSSADFETINHELGHQWFPMMVGSNETWYGWQDEGLNEYIDAAANAAFTKKTPDPLSEGAIYRRVAGAELEAPMMWPTDFAGPYYQIQAYLKAPLALRALGAIVGDSAVQSALGAYAREWRYKHPSPWDFFMSMNRHLGQDLGWFWNAWWFTTETFDQSIASVQQEKSGTLTVRVADRGGMAMPIILRVEYAGGTSETITRPASLWFSGSRTATVALPLRGKRVERITLDPENRFQDVNRTDNVWEGTRAAR